MISRTELEAALEAVLFAAAQPVPVERLTGLFEGVVAEDFDAAAQTETYSATFVRPGVFWVTWKEADGTTE